MADTTSAATDIQNVTVTLTTRGRSPSAKSSIVISDVRNHLRLSPNFCLELLLPRAEVIGRRCWSRRGCGGCLSTFGIVSIAFSRTFQTASVPRIAKSNCPAGPIGILSSSSQGPS